MLVQDMARALLLAAAAFVLTLFVGGWWVKFARRHKLGKQIRIDGPQSHMTKMGTPTMGGVMIVSTVVLLTVLFNLVDRWSMLLPLAVLVSFAVLGGIDDWMTLTKSHSKTYGFTVRYKFLLMLAVAFIASLALYLPKPFGLEHDGLVQIPFLGERNIGVWFIPIATLIIVFISNAVNITDGLDSLAGWNLTMAFAAYGVMTFLAEPRLTNLMAFSFTLVGACAAFLWYNAHPAQVFMGDLGSLALGAVLAIVALQSQQWLLLPVVGVIFIVEALSSMLQTGYFKWTKHRYGEGRRIFKMAPLHHHFELLGWSQVQVTQRFVLIGTVAAMVAISLAITFARPSPDTQRADSEPIVVVETPGQ
ncbi:phospho-N-acetylmuramoyl-pentapeptide-transferase [Chloroflexales bacterium ZM16-3]|nr:phospho-N-acetylmuramoyl-pentapeptide-transferase [Chloroflexales bacterium ZM16-3]